MKPDSSHDAELRSWVDSANLADADFPIQNLPFGRFRHAGSSDDWRIGVAIGDRVLDLREASICADWEPRIATTLTPLAAGNLNDFMALGQPSRQSVRLALSNALAEGSSQQRSLEQCLVSAADVELTLPCTIGDYTDFYVGIHHATAVGKLFRPDNPLFPNYRWIPIGYHGRSSSIVVSGHSIRRPQGQAKSASEKFPTYGPTERLDLELELGFLIGKGNPLGEPVPIEHAEDHLFGLTLLNDWSARDIQAWEYQPLGPFLAKNFASTISPWVVKMEALAPFRVPFERAENSPQPLAYLDSPQNRAHGGIDVRLEIWLQTGAMRGAGMTAVRLAQSSAKEAAFWTPPQLVAHHTSSGCNLRPGDLLGSGTLSGPLPDQAGSMLELTDGGKRPIHLPNGETRTFLEDGDTLSLRAWCERVGARRIGFGECSGTILPSR